MRIGVVAPACPLEQPMVDAVESLSAALFGADKPELVVHPQCFLTHGHFAGPDDARAEAFVQFANDPEIDAIWFARGGYGSNRIALDVLDRLEAPARRKTYLGYSDMGFLLAGLSARGIGQPVHGPHLADIKRTEGAIAVTRALSWLVTRDSALEEASPRTAKRMAFNMTVLATLLGTPLQPDFTGVELLLEDVDEHHYRLDRTLFGLLANPAVQKVRGIRLGRCTPIPENDRPFGLDEEAIARHWCQRFNVPYLGRADIGHDVGNKIVRFG